VRKVDTGEVDHLLRADVEVGEVRMGDGVNGAGDDTIDMGGTDAERGDTREHVTSSHEVVGEQDSGKRLPDMLRDRVPRLSLGGDDCNKLVGVFPLEVDARGGCKEGVGDRDVLLVRGGRGDEGTLIGYTLVVMESRSEQAIFSKRETRLS